MTELRQEPSPSHELNYVQGPFLLAGIAPGNIAPSLGAGQEPQGKSVVTNHVEAQKLSHASADMLCPQKSSYLDFVKPRASECRTPYYTDVCAACAIPDERPSSALARLCLYRCRR